MLIRWVPPVHLKFIYFISVDSICLTPRIYFWHFASPKYKAKSSCFFKALTRFIFNSTYFMVRVQYLLASTNQFWSHGFTRMKAMVPLRTVIGWQMACSLIWWVLNFTTRFVINFPTFDIFQVHSSIKYWCGSTVKMSQNWFTILISNDRQALLWGKFATFLYFAIDYEYSLIH
jgi:hypothetical protein